MARYKKYPVKYYLNNEGPAVWGMCDLSGEMHPRSTLKRQLIQSGNDITWNGLWVYEKYLEPLNEQRKPPPVGGDPTPVRDARPGPIITNDLYRINYGGTPIASQGDATPCFVAGGVGLAQSQSNGTIGYAYNIPVAPIQIDNIGIEAISVSQFQVSLDYTINGVDWLVIYETDDIVYAPTNIQWFPIVTPPAIGYRIRGLNGVKLAIRQLYLTLNNPPSF